MIGPVEHEYTLAASMGLWVQGMPGGVQMRNDLESARGFAASMLDRGADQIYVFNHFNPTDFDYTVDRPGVPRIRRHIFRQLVSEAGRLETALDKPRRHILTFHDTAPRGVENPKPLPASVSKGKSAKFRIHTGPKPQSGKAVLRVGLAQSKGLWEAHLKARVNAVDCRSVENLNRPGEYVGHKGKGSHVVWSVKQVAPRVAQFDVPLLALQRGYNQIEIELTNSSDQIISWLEILITP